MTSVSTVEPSEDIPEEDNEKIEDQQEPENWSYTAEKNSSIKSIVTLEEEADFYLYDKSEIYDEGDDETNFSLLDQPTTESMVKEKIVPPGPPPEFEPYTGLSPERLRKHYFPQYPDDLKFTRICVEPRIRTSFNGQQPILRFSPPVRSENVQPVEQLETKPTKHQGGFRKNIMTRISSEKVIDETFMHYIEKYNLQLLFEYFMSMCVFEAPPDPYKYISNLCDQLIRGRSSCDQFRKIPKLIHRRHIEALYRLYDKVEVGYINNLQYQNAMDNLGIIQFNEAPEGFEDDKISKEIFMKEARKAYKNLIRSFSQYMPSSSTSVKYPPHGLKSALACVGKKNVQKLESQEEDDEDDEDDEEDDEENDQ